MLGSRITYPKAPPPKVLPRSLPPPRSAESVGVLSVPDPTTLLPRDYESPGSFQKVASGLAGGIWNSTPLGTELVPGDGQFLFFDGAAQTLNANTATTVRISKKNAGGVEQADPSNYQANSRFAVRLNLTSSNAGGGDVLSFFLITAAATDQTTYWEIGVAGQQILGTVTPDAQYVISQQAPTKTTDLIDVNNNTPGDQDLLRYNASGGIWLYSQLTTTQRQVFQILINKNTLVSPVTGAFTDLRYDATADVNIVNNTGGVWTYTGVPGPAGNVQITYAGPDGKIWQVSVEMNVSQSGGGGANQNYTFKFDRTVNPADAREVTVSLADDRFAFISNAAGLTAVDATQVYTLQANCTASRNLLLNSVVITFTEATIDIPSLSTV